MEPRSLGPDRPFELAESALVDHTPRHPGIFDLLLKDGNLPVRGPDRAYVSDDAGGQAQQTSSKRLPIVKERDVIHAGHPTTARRSEAIAPPIIRGLSGGLGFRLRPGDGHGRVYSSLERNSLRHRTGNLFMPYRELKIAI